MAISPRSRSASRKLASPQATSKKTSRLVAAPTIVQGARLLPLDAMRAELKRSMAELRLGHHGRPYFASYLLRIRRSLALTAVAGAIVEDEIGDDCTPYVEVRVGSYLDDNSDPTDSVTGKESETIPLGPLDPNPLALRRMFWLLTDQAYKAAAQERLEKRGRHATRPENDKRLAHLSREIPVKDIGPDRSAEFTLDRELWRDRLRTASKLFLDAPWIEDSSVALRAHHTRQYFVSSEGAEHVQESVAFALWLHAETTAPRDGAPLDFGLTLNLGRREELPKEEALAEHVRKIIRELDDLRVAPILPPYVGPAMLGPDVTGVIFHEAIGHRLEGERLRLRDEGHTFKGKVGKRILPTFIDLVDDPTQHEFNGLSITGHYKFDEQGVTAQPVELVRRGVLKNYLLSRVPVPGFDKSNGHGRSDGTTRPQARMGVFIIKTEKPHTREELKALLLEECRKQKKPFGLLLEKIDNGLTNTQVHEFQAFAETPTRVFKVNAKTGEETRVRGVDIVGTPLTTINRIVAMGDDYHIFNGFCGAESGYIPQSEIAPSCVVSEIEVQRSSANENKRPPILPPPSLL